MVRITREDVALVRAAASLAAHAPERMCAAHLAAGLEELARRLARDAGQGRGERGTEPGVELPRAA